MRGGFRPLVNPGTPVGDIDIEDTREFREEVRRQLVLREHLKDVFAKAQVGDDGVQITLLDSSQAVAGSNWDELVAG